MPKIYIIDNEEHKRSWLAPLLAELGAGWEGGFANPAEALGDANQLHLAASSGPGNVVLLDIYMKEQSLVADDFIRLIPSSPAGDLADSYYEANNDKAYRLACYVYAVCVVSRTPVFSISTMSHPITSIRSYDIFAKDLPKPTVLTWPNGLKPTKRNILLLRSIFEDNAKTIRSQMDRYIAFKTKYEALEKRLKMGETWPPHKNGQLFPEDPWHSLGGGSAWAGLACIDKTLVKKLNAAFKDLCTPLETTRPVLPYGTGGVSSYWPLLAAKGLHDGKISLRFIEWLLGSPETESSSHLAGFKAADDGNNAEFIAALCTLAGHKGENGRPFQVMISIVEKKLIFAFSANASDAAAAAKIVTDINKSPEERAAESERNGNPGTATVARHKLESFTHQGNFRAASTKHVVSITGRVDLDNLR